MIFLGELSSISGSDSSDTDEAEDLEYTRNYFHEEEPNQENEENIFVKHPLKKFFVTTNGTLISFYKNIVIKKVGFCDTGFSVSLTHAFVFPGCETPVQMLVSVAFQKNISANSRPHGKSFRIHLYVFINFDW